jgi:hypothetical protein
MCATAADGNATADPALPDRWCFGPVIFRFIWDDSVFQAADRSGTAYSGDALDPKASVTILAGVGWIGMVAKRM